MGMKKKPSCLPEWIPMRYVVVSISSMGSLMCSFLVHNLSMAIVAMTNSTTTSSAGVASGKECPVSQISNTTNPAHVVEPEFNWEPGLYGAVLSGFFLGYLIMQIPGGRLAEVYGTKLTIGIAIGTSSVCSLLVPVLARWSVYALIVVRAIAGLAQGMYFPSLLAMCPRWCPRSEITIFFTVSILGVYVGAVITPVIVTSLIHSGLAGGWPSAFYVTGSCGLAWSILWIAAASSYPEDHPWITDKELKFIMAERIASSDKNRKLPWKKLLLSVPLWALCVNWLFSTFAIAMLLSMLPTYLGRVVNMDLRTNGVANVIINTSDVFIPCSAALVADALIRKGRLSRNHTRKLFECIACFGGAVGLLCVPLSKCNYAAVIASFVVYKISIGFSPGGGAITSAVELAPDFSGTVVGITNTFFSICSFLTPIVIGQITRGQNDLGTWSTIFYLAAGVTAAGGFVFLFFGRAEPLPWATLNSKDDSHPELHIQEKKIATYDTWKNGEILNLAGSQSLQKEEAGLH